MYSVFSIVQQTSAMSCIYSTRSILHQYTYLNVTCKYRYLDFNFVKTVSDKIEKYNFKQNHKWHFCLQKEVSKNKINQH